MMLIGSYVLCIIVFSIYKRLNVFIRTHETNIEREKTKLFSFRIVNLYFIVVLEVSKKVCWISTRKSMIFQVRPWKSYGFTEKIMISQKKEKEIGI